MPEYNECEPIVIYPLGVTCQSTNPSSVTASDGVASLIITGGTPPYSILWGNGSKTNSISNLSVGSYPVTVTDYFGDFTANTTCVLTVVEPTLPPEPTPTPPPVITYDLCMVINYFNPTTGINVLESVHFNPNGVVNNKQSWISDDENYTITWNSSQNLWQVNDYGQVIVNSNPAYPPINNWNILGKKGSVTVSEGECENVDNLSLNVSYNATTCTSCDGTITLVGVGGTPPYQYSINGGLTWSTNGIFQGLCPDITYSIKVKDSTDTIYTPNVNNTILFPSVPTTTYTVTLNNTYINLSSTSYQINYTINVTPPLPAGVTLNFDLELQDMFQRTPYINSANATYTTSVIKNGVPITTYINDVNDTTVPNVSVGCTNYLLYRSYYKHTYESLTLTSTDSYVITAISSYQKTCNNTPPSMEINYNNTPEPTPTPVYVGEVEEYNGGPGPMAYGTSTGVGIQGSTCCTAGFNQRSGALTKTTLSGCQCCNVTGEYFINRT
jgi:hypothetical protein